MPGITDVPGIEVFGKGRAQFELPCGYVDEGGRVHKKVTLRELTGAEEDLMDDDDLPVTERTTRILSACCERVGDVSDPATIEKIIGDKLAGRGHPITSSDRIAMLIFLRRVSLGNMYHFQRRCPRCGHENKKHLDLRSIKMTGVPEDRVCKRVCEVVLPGSKRKARLRVLSAAQESRITDLRPNQKDLRSAAILARLEALEEPSAVDQLARVDDESADDREPEAVTPMTAGKPEQTPGQMVPINSPSVGLELVKALPQQDRNFLRQVYNKMEADVDTSVEVGCDSRFCGADFTFPLDLGQAFFLSPEAEQLSDEALNWL